MNTCEALSGPVDKAVRSVTVIDTIACDSPKVRSSEAPRPCGILVMLPPSHHKSMQVSEKYPGWHIYSVYMRGMNFTVQ